MSILRPTEEVESEVDDQKESQSPNFPGEGDEVMKATELKYENRADPKITIELPDPQSSREQDERENGHSASTSDEEQRPMSKLQL